MGSAHVRPGKFSGKDIIRVENRTGTLKQSCAGLRADLADIQISCDLKVHITHEGDSFLEVIHNCCCSRNFLLRDYRLTVFVRGLFRKRVDDHATARDRVNVAGKGGEIENNSVNHLPGIQLVKGVIDAGYIKEDIVPGFGDQFSRQRGFAAIGQNLAANQPDTEWKLRTADGASTGLQGEVAHVPSLKVNVRIQNMNIAALVEHVKQRSDIAERFGKDNVAVAVVLDLQCA